ncbi:MAG: hypothetical protein N2234_04270 [Planctomycetota bacterium]|nr:hypothetical protein [Planctomycetota bacterium]
MAGNRRSFSLFFSVGFVAQTAQILIFREIFLNFQGNELSFGITFSIWLLFLASGALVFSVVKTRPSTTLFALFSILLAYLPICVHLLRISKSWTALPQGQMIPLFKAVIYTSSLVGPLVFICGALFSSVLKYNEEEKIVSPTRIYILDALGNLFAGLLFSFVFSLFLNHFQLSFIAMGVCFFSLVLSLSGAKQVSAFFLLLATCGLLLFASSLERLSEEARFRAINPQLTLLDINHSPYGETAVVRLPNSEQIDFYINGNYYFSFSESDPYRIAVQAHTLLSLHPAPSKILLLGNLTIISEILLHPLERIDTVELDPFLIRMFKRHLSGRERLALDDPRVSLNTADPRAYVADAPSGEYDIVASYAAEPLTLSSNRLFTEQFFAEVKRILRPGGVFVLSLTVEPDAQSEMVERTLCILNTLKRVFAHTRSTPAHLTAASDSPILIEPATLAERYKSRAVKSAYFDPALYDTFFNPSEQERIDEALRRFAKEAKTTINRDENPVAVVKSLRLYQVLSSDEDRTLYQILGSIKPIHIAIGAVFLLLCGVVLRVVKKTVFISYSVYISVFTCGLFGMAESIMVLLILQSTVGAAYSLVGALSGAFMFGLAGGAEIALKWNLNTKKPLSILLLLSITLIFCPIFILPLYHLLKLRMLMLLSLLLLSTLSGGVVGAVYRTALAILKDSPKSASRVYAVDLLGATAGSIVVGCALLLTQGILVCAVSVFLLLTACIICAFLIPRTS